MQFQQVPYHVIVLFGPFVPGRGVIFLAGDQLMGMHGWRRLFATVCVLVMCGLVPPLSDGVCGSSGEEDIEHASRRRAERVYATACGGSSRQRELTYTSTWIGNSWPGGPNWVQTTISALYVLPDGTLLTASSWDEAHRENTIYSHEGEIVAGVCSSQARAIAANERYVYARVNRAVDGKRMQGIARYFRDRFVERAGPGGQYRLRWCTPAPFEGGMGPHKNELYLAESVPYYQGRRRQEEILQDPEAAEKYRHPRQQIVSMAVDGSQLFIAEDITHRIHILDCETMEEVGTIKVEYPGALAVVPGGNVWVVRRPKHSGGLLPGAPWLELGDYEIVELTRDGRATGRVIRGVRLPSAMCVTPDGTRLIVADSHPERLQVVEFALDSPRPRPVGVFGEPGGVYGGSVPGVRGPNRLNYISGVGVDAHGCLFVASRAPSGSWLRRYSPARAFMWERYTATFMNGAVAVPGTDGTDVFIGRGGSNRLHVDYARTTGPLDRWYAVTWDPYRYPEDVRRHGFYLQRLPNGRLYIVLHGIESGTLVLRQQPGSHIFVPSLYMNGGQYHGNESKTYPPHHPGKHRFMWRDVNGNGRIEKEEYVYVGPAHNAWSWTIDSKGDLWEFHGRSPLGFVRHRLRGFDAHGNPLYDFSLYREAGRDQRGRPRYQLDMRRLEYFPLPEPFGGHQAVRQFFYDADRDRMFVFGFPADMPEKLRNVWSVGRIAARYDNFTSGPRLVSVVSLPYGKRDERNGKPDAGDVIRAVAVAGELLFAARTRATEEGQVWVWNTSNGQFLGTLKPGKELWGETSLVDIPEGIHALRRSNGEYVVFVENNWKNLQIVYRIPPQPGLE